MCRPLLSVLLCLALTPRALSAAEPPDALTFEKDILPIFRAKCIRCHAGVEPKAGLNLTRPSSLLSGGKSGAAIRIRAAEFSLLYEKVTSGEMPAVGQKLTDKEKGLIRKWINDGAEGVSNAAAVGDDADVSGIELWSFQPPKRPAVPSVPNADRVRNPIDAFVLRSLQEQQLTLAPEADRHTLLRRASFDLTGLPPTPQDIALFVNDEGSNAYGRMVDRLLSNPRYGERWARHWLDAAGYTESAGILNEDRALPLAWRYRDYVISAFNNDKPYDRFLQEQIAGDELTGYWKAEETLDSLPNDVVEGIIATGYLRTAADPSRPDFKTIKNAAAQYFYPTIFDTLQIVCSSTMGLTIQCARCHSHKFDPIPQTDYFRMEAILAPAYRPDDWIPQMNRRLQIATKKQKDAATTHNAQVDAAVKKLKDELAALKTTFTNRLFDDRLAKLPEEIRSDVKTALTTAADKRSAVQKYLADKFQKTLKPAGKELDEALATYDDFKTGTADLNAKVAAEEARRRRFDEVRALYDTPGDVVTNVLLRGDPLVPGPEIEPGVISTLQTPQPFEWSDRLSEKTSGRRLAFARWLTQPEHPLTARVMVNRIWMHHFGRGIVATPDDFGISGDPPSHPELLDWLATEFVRSGWSVKHIHRLILTSSAWRQRSRVTEQHRQAGLNADPDNHLLWRQRLRRLEAEPLRDSVLAVSGSLNGRMHGASQPVSRRKDGEVIVSGGADQNRRSVYVQVLRLKPETMLQVFDQPTISVNCTQRSTSTVSTQALTILNSDSMVRAATAFAESVLAEQPDSVIDNAVLTAFGRPATADERALLSVHLDELTSHYLEQRTSELREQSDVLAACRKQALTDVCHMLLSANEFVYVD